jgi:hypothetical protein
MTHTRKLIEVALTPDAIHRESAREKFIHHGHPSTLHLGWARRPPNAGLDTGDARLRFIQDEGRVQGGVQAEHSSTV